jgi:hypothetical protein
MMMRRTGGFAEILFGKLEKLGILLNDGLVVWVEVWSAPRAIIAHVVARCSGGRTMGRSVGD